MKRDPFPCIWVASSHRLLGNEHGRPQWYTVMDEGGTRTLLDLGLQPVSYPGVPADRLATMLDTVDGVFLGGSATNVHPRHYGEDPASGNMNDDETRDAVTLPLVRLAIERGVPLMAVCRGSHEMNVALGGSLHQSLKALGDSTVHWEDPEGLPVPSRVGLGSAAALSRHHGGLCAGLRGAPAGALNEPDGRLRSARPSFHGPPGSPGPLRRNPPRARTP